MAQFKSRPRRLTILPKDLTGARQGHYRQCVVARAARRQWKKSCSVAYDDAGTYGSGAHITVWPPDASTPLIYYVCTDPLFTRLVEDFDHRRPLKLPATFLLERRTK